MEANAPATKKWSLRELLRRVFRRRSSVTQRVVEPATPPVEDPPSPTTNLTKTEKEMITKALQRSGTWYKCPNSHPYLVGACGIPRQLARCPTCGHSIGGHDHNSATASGSRKVKSAFS